MITGTIDRPTKRKFTAKDGTEKHYLTFSIKNQDQNKTTFINVSCFNTALLRDKAEQLLGAKGYWLVEGDLSSYKRQDDTWAIGVNMTNCVLLEQAQTKGNEQEEDDAIIWN